MSMQDMGLVIHQYVLDGRQRDRNCEQKWEMVRFHEDSVIEEHEKGAIFNTGIIVLQVAAPQHDACPQCGHTAFKNIKDSANGWLQWYVARWPSLE